MISAPFTSVSAGAAGRGAPPDGGSATVEAVGLMIPALGACIVLMMFGLHLAAAGQSLTAAAAAAARAASLQPTIGAALAAARIEVESNLGSAPGETRSRCATLDVELDDQAFGPGGTAAISVTCTLSVGDLTGIGLPGTLTRTVTSRAPIDLYTASTGRTGRVTP